MPLTDPCPCGSRLTREKCCAPYLSHRQLPDSAEQLMRSRYCAYVLDDRDYLRWSWHPDTCPARLDIDAGTTWLALKVRAAHAGGPLDEQGTVEFVARYRAGGRGYRLHENSLFRRFQGRWVYVGAVDAGDSPACSPA